MSSAAAQTPASVQYEYDSAGRLRSATHSNDATTHYTLDAAGNRVQLQSGMAPGGRIGFTDASANVGVSEAVGTVSLQVSRTGLTTQAVTVSYSAVADSATASGDYTLASGTLSWGAGDAANKTISVTIRNDSTPEASEQFSVTLSNPTGGAALRSTSRASIVIADDDLPTFSVANQSVNEDAGMLEVTVALTASPFSHQVSYTTASGSATATSDFTTKSGTLSFSPNQTSQVISVPILDDTGGYEGDETFTMTLSSATNGSKLGTAVATMTIVENEPAPSFVVGDQGLFEDGGTASFAIVKIGDTQLSHSVSYATSDNGSAVAGTDYTATSGTLTFGPFETVKRFDVRYTNDTVYESDETFRVTLTNPTGGATLAGPIAIMTIIQPLDTTAPAVVALQDAIPESNTSLRVIWLATTDTGGAGLAGYRVNRNGSEIATTTATSYVDTGLTPGTLYKYTVQAFDAATPANVSAVSREVSGRPADFIPPSVPSGVTATAVSGTQINVAWNASTDTGGAGLAGYRVFRNGSLITSTTSTSYSDTGLQQGTNYSYTVDAYDAASPANFSLTSSAVNARTLGSPPVPAAPTGFVVSATHTGSTLSWNAVSGATRYEAEEQFAGVFYSGTATSTTKSGATGEIYLFSVRACNANGCGAATVPIEVIIPCDPSRNTCELN